MATQIDIHPTGEEPDHHAVRATPGVSRTTTVCEVPTQSKLVPALGMKSWLPAIRGMTVILVPHSPSTKPHQSRGCGSTK
jgi:hypothetical protein